MDCETKSETYSDWVAGGREQEIRGGGGEGLEGSHKRGSEAGGVRSVWGVVRGVPRGGKLTMLHGNSLQWFSHTPAHQGLTLALRRTKSRNSYGAIAGEN